MKRFTRTTGVLAIFVLMLTGAMANAQSGNKKAGDPPAPANEKKAKSTGNTPNAQVNPYFQESQNQGEMPAHNRRASGASQSQTTPGMQNAQSNPMYKDDKREGTNPLYERTSDDNNPSRHHPSENKTTKAQPPANSASHETVEYKDPEDRTTRSRSDANKASEYQEGGENEKKAAYKDPEDMTTRYRPGNNKTTKATPPAGSPSNPSVVEYKDGEDGTMHTRPSKPK